MNPRNQRLKEVYKELQYRSFNSFAADIGSNQTTVSNYITGKRVPKEDFLELVHNRYPQYNLRWLLDGVSDKYNHTYVEIRDNGHVIANNNGGDNIIGDKGLWELLVESLKERIKTLEMYNEHLLRENELLRGLFEKLK